MNLSTALRPSVALLLCVCGPLWAQSPLMPPVEYEKRIRATEMVTALSSDLFGDSVSLYNGSTEFSTTNRSERRHEIIYIQGRFFVDVANNFNDSCA